MPKERDRVLPPGSLENSPSDSEICVQVKKGLSWGAGAGRAGEARLGRAGAELHWNRRFCRPGANSDLSPVRLGGQAAPEGGLSPQKWGA